MQEKPERITIADAAKRLGKPEPTVRVWASPQLRPPHPQARQADSSARPRTRRRPPPHLAHERDGSKEYLVEWVPILEGYHGGLGEPEMTWFPASQVEQIPSVDYSKVPRTRAEPGQT